MTTINFRNQGTFTSAVFNSSGVTITGSNLLSFLNLNGLAIVGGNSTLLDTGEWVNVSFGEAMTAVSVTFFSIFNSDGDASFGEGQVEAFGATGASLGVVNRPDTVVNSTSNISALFGNQPITGFRFTSTGDGFRIGDLSFSRQISITTTDPIALEIPSQTATFRISRQGNGTAPVTVNLALNRASTASFSDFTLSGGGATVTGNTATVTIPSGASFVDVTLMPVDDDLVEPDETVWLDLANGDYAITPSQNSATATILASDFSSATVTRSTPNLVEGGATAELSVHLNAQPTRNVALVFNGGNQLSPSTPLIAFTPANWNVPQTLTISATDDSGFEGLHSGLLTFITLSADSRFESIAVAPLIFSITDNDLPPNLTHIGTPGNDNSIGGPSNDNLQGLAGNDRLNGLAGKDNLNGGLGNDSLVGGLGGDSLTGGAGSDRFIYSGPTKAAALQNSLLTDPDRITDFNAMQGDRILLDFDNNPTTRNLPRGLFNSGTRAGATLDAAVRAAFLDKNQATSGNQSLLADEAVFLKWQNKTYLAVNDGTAGFSRNNDLLIELTGMVFQPGGAIAGVLNVNQYFA
jgi:Ca2+-binding RTX toxin-like protein